jgi:signal transduction histidine kinase
MFSIRRTLTAYLMVLLAVTLGVAGVVIDQMTGRALEAREKAAGELIRNRYKDRVDAEKKRVENALLAEARDIGNIMQSEYQSRVDREWDRFRGTTGQGGTIETLGISQAAPLTALAFPLNPMGAFVAAGSFPPPYREGGRWIPPSPVAREAVRVHFANLQLPEEFIRSRIDDEEHVSDYVQLNQPVGPGVREWHSKSLKGAKLRFDPKAFDNTKLVDWRYKDTDLLGSGQPVHSVVYWTPLYLSNRRPPAPRPTGWAPLYPPVGSATNPSTPSPNTNLDWVPRLYVQCARPKAELDKEVAKFAADRDDELAWLAQQVRTERMTLRISIAAIGLLTFLAVAVGGPLIVGRGLQPVGKLSDAVSRVSEKDFHLPHDGTNLPQELVPIHDRITQTLDLLRRAFAREKQAVGDISHELRTPIASLLATIDVALRKPRTQDQYRSTLEDCRAITKQLNHLVERIMTLATLDAGTARTTIALADAADIASGCAAVIRPLAEAHGVTLDFQADGPLELTTDPDKLREVLMNLLHNAIEYNQPGGRVDLSAQRDNGHVVLEVRDTGIGMTPDVREKIFERFYRADPSRHATGVHAGLGLAIVKEYVERLQGTITVESTPGKGSTFRVSLPAMSAPEQPEPPLPADRADVPEPAPAGS